MGVIMRIYIYDTIKWPQKRKVSGKIRTILYYDPNYKTPDYKMIDGKWYKTRRGFMNPGMDPESWARLGSRQRTALTEFYRASKMGVFADGYPKVDTSLLSQIQRSKLDFSGRLAAPAVSKPQRGDRRVMQIACESPELEQLYDNDITLQKQATQV